jgi:hypothetical protein
MQTNQDGYRLLVSSNESAVLDIALDCAFGKPKYTQKSSISSCTASTSMPFGLAG